MTWRTIVIDPPWPYNDKMVSGNSGFGGKARPIRGAENHYAVMPMAEIAALPLAEWADDYTGTYLFVWTTNAFMREAHELIEAWGFDQKTIITWEKPQSGMGWYFRNNTEHAVFAVRRGKTGIYKPKRRDMPTYFRAPRGRHSEKPAAFYDLIESVAHGPYLDVFARKQRFGWDVAGNEVYSAIPSLQ